MAARGAASRGAGVLGARGAGALGADVLERCLTDSGYTPPVAALPELLCVLTEQEERQRERLERALARAGLAVIEPALAALRRAPAEHHPMLLALLGRVAGEQLLRGSAGLAALRERLRQAFVESLKEPIAASQRWAARALAKLGDVTAEPALLAALPAAALPEARAIVDALGALGGEQSRAALSALRSEDAELERRRRRALALIERSGARQERCDIVLERTLESPAPVLLGCRAGLEGLLADELAELGWSSEAAAGGRELTHAGSLAELLRSRLTLELGIRVTLEERIADPSERLAEALTREQTLSWLQRWSSGRPRFRVDWSDAGHQRARSWALAQSVQRRTTALLNDTERAPWTVRARSDGRGELLLLPRIDRDPRFAYRQRDVRAASHPTIAAALARASELRPDDVVWDPFTGSGLELIERALRGPFAELWGTDIDPKALAAARANLDAAGLRANLVQHSALDFAPPGVTLIISNPPMGRRVARDGTLADLLANFIRHAARTLRPRGRLVWLSPLPRHTARAAREAALSVHEGPDIDLGGFHARLQTYRRQ